MAKTEVCAGASGAHTKTGVMTLGLHCPGCVSATERIAELEQKAAENEKVFLNANATCGDLRIDLAAMRTLAGELVGLLERFRQRNVAECFCVAAFSAGHEERCTQTEILLTKAKELGVDDEK
ncbi:hypothetical protein LCGC14_2907340 [marine sediment metagenome]|uniref:Uncharacterized protein n=1 Tax=marine sediment metagenome TaxID=412755 RepID=A0A0F9A0C1_9ZZZZ